MEVALAVAVDPTSRALLRSRDYLMYEPTFSKSAWMLGMMHRWKPCKIFFQPITYHFSLSCTVPRLHLERTHLVSTISPRISSHY
jgi:hypothetical protein